MFFIGFIVGVVVGVLASAAFIYLVSHVDPRTPGKGWM